MFGWQDNMKKRNFAFLALLICLVLGGCGKKDTYYEIPKSEVIDVSSVNKNNPSATEKKTSQKGITRYTAYTNERFGFSVEIPNYLTLEEESADKEETVFSSKDGDIELGMLGLLGALEDHYFTTAKELYTYVLSEMEYTPKFVEQNNNNFKISWEEDDQICWMKMYLKSDNTGNLLTIFYPKSRQSELEEDVKYILDSFKTGVGYGSDVLE